MGRHTYMVYSFFFFFNFRSSILYILAPSRVILGWYIPVAGYAVFPGVEKAYGIEKHPHVSVELMVGFSAVPGILDMWLSQFSSVAHLCPVLFCLFP